MPGTDPLRSNGTVKSAQTTSDCPGHGRCPVRPPRPARRAVPATVAEAGAEAVAVAEAGRAAEAAGGAVDPTHAAAASAATKAVQDRLNKVIVVSPSADVVP
ncbi:hypothetical protein GCM10010299_21230 [Streptomyces tanashiensis]|nr:hypothetical protein GCM10010299_21230 [Streptomyces tanashiensis]